MSASGPERGINGPHLARLLGSWSTSRPRYVALARTIRLLVLDGRLPLRTRLPGERELAEALGVSRTTAGARVRGAARRGVPRQPPRCRQLDVPPSRPPHRVGRRRGAGRGRRDRPQHARPARRPRVRCTGRSRRRRPSSRATCPGLATTRSGCCRAARRRRRALHAPRRADDAGPGVRDRRRPARVHAAAARAGRSGRPRDGRPPDVSERARRDPRDRRPAGAGGDARRTAGTSTCARRRCARRRRGSRT